MKYLSNAKVKDEPDNRLIIDDAMIFCAKKRGRIYIKMEGNDEQVE